MFGFLKKTNKSEAEKRAESLPFTKKVQFDPIPLERVEEELVGDLRAVLKYSPVNYYATKNSYLLCVFYYNEDYSEIYMRFESHVDDKMKGKIGFFSIDRELLRDILRKFGQNI